MERVILPENFNFLGSGWWIFHVLAVSGVFLIGYLVGARRRGQEWPLATGRKAYDIVMIPFAYRFLQHGWWIMHLILIPMVFILGHMLWPQY